MKPTPMKPKTQTEPAQAEQPAPSRAPAFVQIGSKRFSGAATVVDSDLWVEVYDAEGNVLAATPVGDLVRILSRESQLETEHAALATALRNLVNAEDVSIDQFTAVEIDRITAAVDAARAALALAGKEQP